MKAAKAQKFFATARQQWATAKADGLSPDQTPPGGTPTSNNLPATYYVQQYESWCGPTSITTIADYLGVSAYGNYGSVSDGWSPSQVPYTQQQQAAKLAIDPAQDGTDWYGNDGVPIGSWSSSFPMQDVLNFLTRSRSSNFYDVASVPDSPSTTDINNFEGQLVYDVNLGNGRPLAANEYAAPGYALPRQPSNQTIMHWLAPTGYSASGATTVYEDSGWGAGHSVSASSHSFVVAIGGRGYIF